MKPIFRGGLPRLSLLLLLLGALTLVIADLRGDSVRSIRSAISVILTPVQWLVDIPTGVADDISSVLIDRAALLKDNNQLRSNSILLEKKVQQMMILRAENVRLRELLNASAKIDDQVLLAELIGVNPDPFQHQIILDKGSEDGIFIGQPVLDAGGVMGQVVEVSLYTNRTMLVTDGRHALPVEVVRNGMRAIALGKGSHGELDITHVADNADIRVGDLLVTSALAGRFPYGYPLAKIISVERDPSRKFMIVKAKPAARLDNSRYVLMVGEAEQETSSMSEQPAAKATAGGDS
ncbi:MAG: rod shape-determining protein MreC [Pseudomonadales bacterium]|nr:rod shape-determining protein MreC [Pseudomonadales bacterium]NRA18684.1 rod shape-determining protein MreC [Oceanospirillaceae bacterium]